MNPRFFLAPLVLSLPAVVSAAGTEKLTKEETAFFEGKVRPIFAEHCYKCHSVEQGKAKGGLTLDTKEGWKKGGENGAAVEPGAPDKSLLLKAISYLDADLQMPPKGEKLTDAQIATLTEWVKKGAPDPREAAVGGGKLTGLTDTARHHWAYQPVKKPAIPANKNQQWCRTPVDAFVLQKLEAKQMLPAPDADRETLLRRATYDLIGLPPTPAEIDAFVRDVSPNAFEKVVDRLLASPHYGERWGRFWLDTARYSDTIGGDRNNKVTEYRYPDAWTYRDYVVKSFNQDKPYNQLVLEQLAADQLPNQKDGDPRLAALGFLTVGERFKKVDDIINDRIDVVGKGFLGLTVACARCHDHMFDPIPTKDYYALHGIFSSIYEPEQKPALAIKTTGQQQGEFEQKYAVLLKELQSRYSATVDHYLGEICRVPEIYLQTALGAGKGKGRANDAEALRARNALIQKHDLDEQFVQYLSKSLITNTPLWGPLLEMKRSGKFTLTPETVDGARLAKLEARMADTANGKSAKTIAKMRTRMKTGTNRLVAEALTAAQPKSLEEMIAVYAKLLSGQREATKKFVAAMKNATSASVPGYEDEALVELLSGPLEILPAPLMTRDWIETAQYSWSNKMQGRARLNFGEINTLETAHAGAPAHAMIVADRPNPKDSPVFIRGQSDVKGDIVPRRFLEVLSPDRKPQPFTQGSGRLELAQAIASRDNPLTARVAVNRLWMHHFGEGFVRTPDDLGVQSEAPSHQELLDYLSVYFMDQGWSFKKLHKLVMLSRVYQISSHTRPEYEQMDPENRLLWRANIRRLDFEAMRDSLLVFSGELDRTIGGKPINLTDEPYSYRRSVYGYIDRGNLPELMSAFDFSDPDMPNSKRSTTIVPQQALFLMNSSMTVDVARKIVDRPEVVAATADYSRIAAIYRVIFQRSPTPLETRMALQYLGGEAFKKETLVAAAAPVEVKGRGKNNAQAKKKAGSKDAKFGAIQNQGERVERAPLNVWETYAQALLFSNEAAYVN
jgi:mono/diheme cytochrome c family protein